MTRFHIVTLLLLVACKKESAVALAETATTLSAAAPPATAKVVEYAIDPTSKTSIDMPAETEHIKADTTAAAGSLRVDLENLGNTRGEVKVDLTTLKTHTFEDEGKNASQTMHAHNWLEAGDAVSADVKKANQYAVFAINSVDGISSADVGKVAPTKGDGDDVRTVTATVHGEFLVHGHKAKKDVPIEASFHYAPGTPAGGKPSRIDVKSTSPLHVTLEEHDVHPRDTFGKVAEWTPGLRGKIAKTADITLDLHATLTQ